MESCGFNWKGKKKAPTFAADTARVYSREKELAFNKMRTALEKESEQKRAAKCHYGVTVDEEKKSKGNAGAEYENVNTHGMRTKAYTLQMPADVIVNQQFVEDIAKEFSLKEEQREIFLSIGETFIRRCTPGRRCKQRLIFLTGLAGTGKSRVIDAIS